MGEAERRSLRKKAVEEGTFYDNFEEKSPYWDWRVDNYAGFELEKGVLRMFMGPTEALYYSNAEISDGFFDDLPWSFKTLEVKARLEGDHYGSAGWGFWNHSMILDYCIPIWFIYLRSRGTYPLQGFFVQVGTKVQPIVLFEKPRAFTLAYMLSKISPKLVGIDILSTRPKMPGLKLREWHVYKVEWREDRVKFYIDQVEIAEISYERYTPPKARADVWIDNAVFEIRRNDPGRVYRHVTQENRKRSYLDLDYLKIY